MSPETTLEKGLAAHCRSSVFYCPGSLNGALLKNSDLWQLSQSILHVNGAVDNPEEP